MNSRRRMPDTRASSLVVGRPHHQPTTTWLTGPWDGPALFRIREAIATTLYHPIGWSPERAKCPGRVKTGKAQRGWHGRKVPGGDLPTGASIDPSPSAAHPSKSFSHFVPTPSAMVTDRRQAG